MLIRMTCICGLVTALLAVCGASASDWPQWRGPFLNGSTDEAGLPSTWSATENVRWKTPMPGPGAATPIIHGDRVFLTAVDIPTKNLVALCVAADTGTVLWTRVCGRNRRAKSGNTMASPSAVTDGKAVFFYFGTGDLVAFDTSGNRLWAREVEKDHGPYNVKFGYSGSPLLHNGMLYVVVMRNRKLTRYGPSHMQWPEPLDSFILAIDPATGKDVWKHVRETDATDESVESYITPIPYDHGDRAELIVVGGEHVTGHDTRDGREVWRWAFIPNDRQIWQRVVTSAVCGDGLIYAIRPKHRPVFALKAGGKGRLDASAVAWSIDKFTPDVTTPLLYRGRLYLLDGDKRVMSCVNPDTGAIVWRGELGGKSVFRASPTGADGKVYCISKGGEALVLAAGDRFEILSRIQVGEQPCLSTISAAGGRLYLRTKASLICIEKQSR